MLLNLKFLLCSSIIHYNCLKTWRGMHQATGGSHFLPHRDICKEDQEGDWWRWIDCSSTVARALMHVYERLNERRCPKVGQEAPRGIKKEVCMAANFIATSPKWNFHLLIFGIRRKLAWFYNWTRESFAFFSTFCKIFAFLSYLAIVEQILCKLDIFAIFKWNFEDFQIHYKFILTLEEKSESSHFQARKCAQIS